MLVVLSWTFAWGKEYRYTLHINVCYAIFEKYRKVQNSYFYLSYALLNEKINNTKKVLIAAFVFLLYLLMKTSFIIFIIRVTYSTLKDLWKDVVIIEEHLIVETRMKTNTKVISRISYSYEYYILVKFYLYTIYSSLPN